MNNPPKHNAAAQQVREVIERLFRDGSIVSNADGSTHDVRATSITPGEGNAVRKWVVKEAASKTIETGLACGISALHICEGLLSGAREAPLHVVIDPCQATHFANCGLQALEEAGVSQLVEHHSERSQVVLPQFLKEGRTFDLGFVDGNHRFDYVFLDLFYLGHLVRKGGIIILDDYNSPGIERAVSFFVNNLGWKIEETSPPDDGHCWVVLRTAKEVVKRHYSYFADF